MSVPADDPVLHDHELHDLDDLLTQVRVAQQRTGYRRRVLQDVDIPGGVATLRVLRAVELLSAETVPSVGDVATRLAVQHSTASRSVDVAVRAGLLTKETCGDDQRRARLALTGEGRSVLRKASARRLELLAAITRNWPGEDTRRLVELLDRLRTGFDALEAGK